MARDTRILGLHWHGWAAILIFVPASAALSVYLSRELASPPVPPAPEASPSVAAPAPAGLFPSDDALPAWPPRSRSVGRESPGTAVRDTPEIARRPVDDESGESGAFLPAAGQYETGTPASARRDRVSRQTVPQLASTARSSGAVADGSDATEVPEAAPGSVGGDPGTVLAGVPVVGGAVFVGGAGAASSSGQAAASPEASQGEPDAAPGPAAGASPVARSAAPAVPDTGNNGSSPGAVPGDEGGGDDGTGGDPVDAAPPFETLSGEGPPPPPRL